MAIITSPLLTSLRTGFADTFQRALAETPTDYEMAYKSKATLDAANFNAAMTAMMNFKADGGRPLGIRPTVLVVPPALRAAAIEIVKNERSAGGASNPNFGVVELIVSPWL